MILGRSEVHTKFGPDRFSRFDVYWIQTDRQTDKQSTYIDYNFLKFQNSSLDPVLQKKVCQKSPSANVRICDKEALEVNKRKFKKIDV